MATVAVSENGNVTARIATNAASTQYADRRCPRPTVERLAETKEVLMAGANRTTHAARDLAETYASCSVEFCRRQGVFVDLDTDCPFATGYKSTDEWLYNGFEPIEAQPPPFREGSSVLLAFRASSLSIMRPLLFNITPDHVQRCATTADSAVAR